MRKTSISYCDPSEYADSWRSGLWRGQFTAKGFPNPITVYETSFKECRHQLAVSVWDYRAIRRRIQARSICTR